MVSTLASETQPMLATPSMMVRAPPHPHPTPPHPIYLTVPPVRRVACLVLIVFHTELCHRSVSVIPESATKRHPPPHTCSSALHHRCHLAAPEPHLLLVFPLSSPAEGDLNPRLQCGSRLRCRWGTCRKTLLLHHNTQERSVQAEI